MCLFCVYIHEWSKPKRNQPVQILHHTYSISQINILHFLNVKHCSIWLYSQDIILFIIKDSCTNYLSPIPLQRLGAKPIYLLQHKTYSGFSLKPTVSSFYLHSSSALFKPRVYIVNAAKAFAGCNMDVQLWSVQETEGNVKYVSTKIQNLEHVMLCLWCDRWSPSLTSLSQEQQQQWTKLFL